MSIENTTMLVTRTTTAQDLPLPTYGSTAASGLDLHAAKDATIDPGKHQLIPTGIMIALPPQHEAQVRPRSGLALKHGITVLNSPGTVDADYRGEVGVILINHGDKPFEVKRGDKIAQLVIASVIQVQLKEVDELPSTDRGSGGFGSTGS